MLPGVLAALARSKCDLCVAQVLVGGVVRWFWFSSSAWFPGSAVEMGVAGEKFQLGTVGALSLSVVSSVSIVICNKALMSSLGFNFGTRCNLACDA